MDNYNFQHLFKLDPAKSLDDEALTKIAESGTDGIIVGGTDGVTLENVLDLLARIRRFSVPVILEVSTIESVTPGFDFYFIPTVLNATDLQYVNGLHHEALKEYGHMMNWEEIATEGYCIMNPHCKAAERAKVDGVPTEEDVVAYAQMAEHMLHLPLFYMEYSGTYGSVELVKEAARHLHDTKLIYGGGIRTKEQAKEMAEVADIVVVGNVIYDDLTNALRTVRAVHDVKKERSL